MDIRDATYRWGGEITPKALGHAKPTLVGIQMFFTKIEKYAGMAKRLARDLAIEKALQIEIKATQAHTNQSYMKWCDR